MIVFSYSLQNQGNYIKPLKYPKELRELTPFETRSHVKLFLTLSKQFGRSWKALNINLLHKQYKKSLIKEKRWIRFYQLSILIIFLSIWELLLVYSGLIHLFLVLQSKIGTLFVDKMSDGTLMPHINVTLFETVLGFIIGTCIRNRISELFFGGLRCYQKY